MKALWFDGRLELRTDLDVPSPRYDEAIVAVSLSGICGTDLHVVRGYSSFFGILGHEFVGHIVAAPAAKARIGERVVGEINVSCGQCEFCSNGNRNHCITRNVLGIRGANGAFAEYIRVPVANLLTLPNEIPDDVAVFTEPVAAALRIQTQIDVKRDDRVLIVGAGRLGQLIALTLKHLGGRLHIVTRYEGQRQKLKTVGLKTVDETDIVPSSYDIVIDATGSPLGIKAAIQAVRPLGTIVLKSTYNDDVSIDISSLIVNEITVVGSRCGPFDSALQLMKSGDIDPRYLIEKIYPISDAIKAFEHAGKPGTLKILLRNAA